MKFIRIESNASMEKRAEVTRRIEKGEIKLSHFAIDNEKGYHYYEILK
jgi:hypothetical protein